MRKSTTGALLASVLALGGVLASPPTVAAAALKPACSTPQEMHGFMFKGEAYLCTRFEDRTLYVSAAVDSIRGEVGDYTFQGNIVITRDGATVAAYPFSETLRDFAVSGSGTGDKVAHDLSLPIFVPGDYEVIMDGHLLVRLLAGGNRVPKDEIIKVTSMRVPIAL